tara:strand:+ start:531 stop:1163 length:633 start_codon:yes stop_codon:yes gene_type:complete
MNILVFAPHADDAEIGMGGTIAKYSAEGHKVLIVCAIIPCEAIDGSADSLRKKIRLREATEAADIIGAELNVLDLDPYKFQFNREYTKIFDRLMMDFSPSKVFCPWEYDTHQDHKTLANIVFSISRKNVSSLYMYESMLPGGISSHGFNPQLFVDVSNKIEIKRKSIEIYQSVFEGTDYPEAIIGRARHRGQQIGVKYAESFEIVKEIIY